MLAAAMYLPALIVIARQQRVLELMIHDASHRAWARTRPWLNHAVANVVAAWPMLSDVERYWQSHRWHHGAYGSAKDPCRRRFNMIGLDDRDLSTGWRIAREVIAWLPGYFREYYREVGASPKRLVVMLLWHCLVYVGPGALLFGIVPALLGWVLFWAVPMMSTLTALRSIAEAEEHDYTRGETEFETTFTNRGIIHRWLIHPWGDAYHQIHHMFPSIPQREHRKVHELLMAQDETYRRSRHRTTILGQN
jgi:fatty acid desaturase